MLMRSIHLLLLGRRGDGASDLLLLGRREDGASDLLWRRLGGEAGEVFVPQIAAGEVLGEQEHLGW